jgi:hypothetical protein
VSKLKNLKVQKLIQEYTFLLTDDEYKKEVVSTYQKDFLSIINGMIKPEEPKKEEEKSDDSKKEGDDTTEQPKKQPKIGDDLVNETTKSKIKKIYRDIVKLTHPDKVNSNDLIKLYIEAKDAYEDNDLFVLYFICGKLNIPLELDEEDTEILNKLIEVKRKELKSIETSFLWQWVHAKNDDEKERMVTTFVEKHYKDRIKK